jgi:hypothetical protein
LPPSGQQIIPESRRAEEAANFLAPGSMGGPNVALPATTFTSHYSLATRHSPHLAGRKLTSFAIAISPLIALSRNPTMINA